MHLSPRRPAHAARAPALLGLDKLLTPIPIVGDVVTALVGNDGKTTTVTTTAASPTASGGGSGNSGTNTGSGDSNSGGGGGSSSGGSDTSSGGSSNSGSSSSNDANGSNPNGDSNSGGSSGSSSGTSPTGSNNNAAAASDVASSGGKNSTSSNSGGSGPAGASPLVNAAAGGSTASAVYTTDAHGSTILVIPTGTSGSGNSGTTDANGGDSNGSGASSGKPGSGGMSGGAVAGVIIGVLVALALFAVIVLRRRANTKRSQRRNWWSSRYGGGKEKDDLDSANATAGRNSVRSSFGTFGTSFDVSTPGHTSADSIIPAMPAMAEVRGGQPLYATNSDTPHDMAHQQTTSPISPPGTGAVDMRRVSAFSVGSINSDDSSNNPFLDPPLTPSAFPLPPSQYRPLATPITPHTPISPATNTLPKPVATKFSEVETILRPFAPTLADELRVDVGDRVKIQQVFDDGWVAVESTANGHAEVGLVPVDCLRAKEQDLPAFLAAKRVSSYTVAAGMPHH